MDLFCFGIHTKFRDVQHIECKKLSEWINGTPKKDNLILLDVREAEEYQISHIEDAIHVSPSVNDESLLSILKEKSSEFESLDIVCYCSVGYRSSCMVRRIHSIMKSSQLIPINVSNLNGSLFKWACEGNPMVNSHNVKTTFVHPYNSVFGAFIPKEMHKYSVA